MWKLRVVHAGKRVSPLSDIYIGISGWRYAPWRGVFYPKGLPHRRELEFASRALPTIEINGSFYSLHTPASYARLKGRARLAVDRVRPLRHAMEIRHESFLDESFIALLRRHRIALVVADTAGKWPYREDVTADFVYLRLHGDKKLYASGYTDAALDRWAERIRAWSGGGEPADARRISGRPPPARRSRDVYCCFDNDVKVRAPFDAQRLMEKLGLEVLQKLPRSRIRLGVRAAVPRIAAPAFPRAPR